MALEELLAALTHEAEAEAERFRAEARAETAALHAAAERKFESERDAALGVQGTEQEGALQMALAAARLEARHAVLQAREEVLDRLFLALQGACPAAVERQGYRDSIPPRVARALACFDVSEPVILTVPATLAEAAHAATSGEPRVTVVVADDAGSGLRFASSGGAVEVADTLESGIARNRASLARAGLQALGLAR